jgi:hypothetical protein
MTSGILVRDDWLDAHPFLLLCCAGMEPRRTRERQRVVVASAAASKNGSSSSSTVSTVCSFQEQRKCVDRRFPLSASFGFHFLGWPILRSKQKSHLAALQKVLADGGASVRQVRRSASTRG